MKIKRYGDQACIIEFGEGISKDLHKQVSSFHYYIRTHPLKGVTDMIPAYNSLTLIYDATQINFRQLAKALENIRPDPGSLPDVTFRIPVCYEMALDKDTFCESTGLTWKEIIDIHTRPEYMVFMIGFLPGFLYMGEVEKRIQLPRKKEPRKKVEKGSVGIAGIQTGIYPMASPGGWNILGRTPVSLFNPKEKDPFPVQIGSQIRFFPIGKKDYEVISQDDDYKIEVSHDQ